MNTMYEPQSSSALNHATQLWIDELSKSADDLGIVEVKLQNDFGHLVSNDIHADGQHRYVVQFFVCFRRASVEIYGSLIILICPYFHYRNCDSSKISQLTFYCSLFTINLDSQLFFTEMTMCQTWFR